MHSLAFLSLELEIIPIAEFVEPPVENSGKLRRRRLGNTIVWFLLERLTFRTGFNLEPTGAGIIRHWARRNETSRRALRVSGNATCSFARGLVPYPVNSNDMTEPLRPPSGYAAVTSGNDPTRSRYRYSFPPSVPHVANSQQIVAVGLKRVCKATVPAGPLGIIEPADLRAVGLQ